MKSPMSGWPSVSRTMRELERSLGVALFDRSTRQMRLTWAGQVLLGEARRVLATVDHAVQAANGAAQGYQGFLRIAICDSPAQPRIASLLARSREEEPELGIRIFELPFSQQLKGLHTDLLDIGFALPAPRCAASHCIRPLVWCAGSACSTSASKLKAREKSRKRC
ncbi:HTH-type transcriptional regulator CynR [Xylophilus ampelinus]|jgi:DNA-binding transcriptional LysR family regulator|nr:HTH-type transcriptional regulator CynR [Xylophilus ampelinus]